MNIQSISKAGSAKSKMIYHEDLEQLHINTLPNRCYFVPFGKGQNPFESRENSERFELLNGDWGFRYFASIIDLEDDFTTVVAEKTIPVPSNCFSACIKYLPSVHNPASSNVTITVPAEPVNPDINCLDLK